MFRRFETLLHPYPEAEPGCRPKASFPVWACTAGLRGYIGWLALLSASVSAYEALLFWMLGRIVDWLGGVQPQRLWDEHGPMLELLGGVLLASASTSSPSWRWPATSTPG